MVVSNEFKLELFKTNKRGLGWFHSNPVLTIVSIVEDSNGLMVKTSGAVLPRGLLLD